jgi:RNA polymerase sigma-70 factor (ECF subfamily)
VTPRDPKDFSDSELITAVLSGDRDLFGVLMERHQRRVAAIVHRHVPPEHVDEVCQQTFVDCYRNLASIRDRAGFSGWIKQLAVRRSYDFWRKHYRRAEKTQSDLNTEGDALEVLLGTRAQLDFSEAENRRDARELVQRLLANFSPEDRMVLSLVYLEDMSVAEAAKELGWTTANVKIRSFRARNRLRKMLEEMD